MNDEYRDARANSNAYRNRYFRYYRYYNAFGSYYEDEACGINFPYDYNDGADAALCCYYDDVGDGCPEPDGYVSEFYAGRGFLTGGYVGSGAYNGLAFADAYDRDGNFAKKKQDQSLPHV